MMLLNQPDPKYLCMYLDAIFMYNNISRDKTINNKFLSPNSAIAKLDSFQNFLSCFLAPAGGFNPA